MIQDVDLTVLKAIPLAEIVDALGYQPRDPSRIQWVRDGRMIEITGQAYMEPASQAIGRGAIDLATRLTSLDLLEVIPWLQDILKGVHSDFPTRKGADVRPRSLRLPSRHDHMLPTMHRDLCRGLGISDVLVRALIKVGRLYADERGRAVALMRNVEGMAVGAEVIAAEPDGSAGLQFAFGTRRTEGTFFINGTNPHSRIVMVESAIQAMAYVSLKPHDHAISIAGIFNHDLLDLIGGALLDRGAPVFGGHGTALASVMGAGHLDSRFGWAHLSPITFDPRATTWLHLLQMQRKPEDIEEEEAQ